jgi:hypothetical protein
MPSSISLLVVKESLNSPSASSRTVLCRPPLGGNSVLTSRGVSATLNSCREENVVQMRQAMQAIYRRFGAGYHHCYGREWQLLDISLADLVIDAETVLNLNAACRKRTILRLDGGGGNDAGGNDAGGNNAGGNNADINWLLARGYKLLVKVTHWKRVEKLAATVSDWQTDPTDPRRQAGWVTAPFSYDQPTSQLAVRCQGQQGNWRTTVLVFNLADDPLHWLVRQRKRASTTSASAIWSAVYAYDLRCGPRDRTKAATAGRPPARHKGNPDYCRFRYLVVS